MGWKGEEYFQKSGWVTFLGREEGFYLHGGERLIDREEGSLLWEGRLMSFKWVGEKDGNFLWGGREGNKSGWVTFSRRGEGFYLSKGEG